MLNLPLNMPAEKLRTVEAMAEAFQNVSNVVAVVLGGSYARGFARPDSDIDMDIYYRQASPCSVDQMRSVAEMFCKVGSVPIVTGPVRVGPLNGGAWIQTPVGKVDFLYRNLDQVQVVIGEGRQGGVWRHDYDQQPPYGFRSVVYLGETFICVPIHDPEGEIVRLKESVAEYPELLRNRIVQESLWGAEISLRFYRTLGNSAELTAGRYKPRFDLKACLP